MMEEIGNANIIYLSIIGWKLAQKVTEDTPWAVKREYELSDWNKWVKFEKYFKNLKWTISAIEFKEWPYWDQCIMTISADKDVKISMSTWSQYFTSFARRLPNVKPLEEVAFNAYDFEGDNGKKIRGVTLTQDWEKILDFYFDKENKTALNWMPEADKAKAKKMWKAYWKTFFPEVEFFLKEEVIKQASNFKAIERVEVETEFSDVEKVSVDDFPF